MPHPFRSGRRGGAYLVILGLCLAAGAAFASEPPATDTTSGAPTPLQFFLDHFHLQTTQAQMALSEKLDSYFPNPDNLQFDYRRSRLQLKTGFQINSHGETELVQRLDGRLVLPRAKERLSLFFSGSPREEQEQDEPGAAPTQPPTQPLVDKASMRYGLNTALRLIITRSDFHITEARFGIRFLPSFDPYTELRGNLRFSLGKFLVQPGQIVFWREQERFGETTLCNLDYPLSSTMLLRFHTEATFSEVSLGLEHQHFIAYLHQLSKRRSYTVMVEAEGETRPTSRMSRYLGSLIWKQRIYKDWLFIEAGPRLYFTRDDDFEPVPAVFFALTGEFSHVEPAPEMGTPELP